MAKRMSVRQANRHIRYASNPVAKFKEIVSQNPDLRTKLTIPHFYHMRGASGFFRRLKRDLQRGVGESFRRRKLVRGKLLDRTQRGFDRVKEKESNIPPTENGHF